MFRRNSQTPFMSYFNHPLLKLPLLFGLGAGLAVFAYFMALYATGRSALYIIEKYPLDYGIHIIMMVGAVWYYRKNVGQDMLHLWEGLTICYVVNTVGALVAGWLVYAVIVYVDPTLFTRYISDLMQFQIGDKAAMVKQFGPEAYAALLKQTAESRPDVIPLSMLGKKTLYTIFVALIISLLFRKQDYSVLKP